MAIMLHQVGILIIERYTTVLTLPQHNPEQYLQTLEQVFTTADVGVGGALSSPTPAFQNGIVPVLLRGSAAIWSSTLLLLKIISCRLF